MWVAYDCYLTAFRDILGLSLPQHENYRHWEHAAIEGGFRVMHNKFCIVSDFPEILKIDDQSRPHCADGPSHRWRDGWSLYYWHGVKVPDYWIVNKNTLTATDIFKQPNAEVRRAGCEIIGWHRVLSGIDANLIDSDGDPMIGSLYRGQIPGLSPCGFLKVKCGTGRDFFIPTPDGFETAMEAQAWVVGLSTDKWVKPEIRT